MSDTKQDMNDKDEMPKLGHILYIQHSTDLPYPECMKDTIGESTKYYSDTSVKQQIKQAVCDALDEVESLIDKSPTDTWLKIEIDQIKQRIEGDKK